MRKKILAILLVVVLSVSMLPAAVSADGGEFTFDAETGTITGYTDKSVTELAIPAEIDGVAVTAIGFQAFGYFFNLKNVLIPNSVTRIETNAFCYCENIETINIPDGVSNIGEVVFIGCDNLTSIIVSENNRAFASAEGVLYSKDMKTLVCCPGGKSGSLAIPDGVLTIGHSAVNCALLTNVNIPDSVTTIGWCAFSGCESLSSIQIPKDVAIISDGAFEGCTSLTSIFVADENSAYTSYEGALYTKDMSLILCCPSGKTGNFVIPNGVTKIDSLAFGVCKSLSSVTIPVSVTQIEYWAFPNCNSLTDVYYSGTEEEWNAIVISEGNECLTNATIHYNSTDPEPAPVKTYADVPETHWAAEAISYVTEAGLFKGTSATEFSPNGNMTRAMLMVVLARLDGVDTEGGDGKWYEKGMEWAVEQGITDGSSPNANITRQQLVTMLWRYAGKPASNASLDGYSDASEVASWATEAMKWAVENGIIKGTKKDVLSPNGYATRAQVATIIMRFVDM